MSKNETAESLNSIVRGEIAAVETYEQALEKVDDRPERSMLQSMLDDHRDAQRQLSKHVQFRGEEASKSSGAWGTWAKTVTGTAKLFGDSSALKALKEGEEHGLKEYQSLLEDKEIDPTVKSLVTSKFIPSQQRHIATLDGMIDRINR